MTFAALLAAVAAVFLALPAVAADDGAERAAIARERSAAEARFAARDRACRERFVVSGCVDEARRERRSTLDALRARQLAIDEVRRKDRATARRSELATKAADDEKRERERAAKAAAPGAAASSASSARVGKPLEARHAERAASRPPSTAGGHDRPVEGGSRLGIKPRSSPLSASERQAREAQSRAAFETRRRQAQEHREEAIAAAAKRMQRHSPGTSLPVPPASPAASSR